MLQTSILDAVASTVSATDETATTTSDPQPEPAEAGSFETVNHVVFGNPDAVRLTIQSLHQKRYAEPNDWSKLLPTGRPNEVMVILTRRVRVT